MSKILYFITDMDLTGIKLALEHKDNEVGIALLQDAVYFGCEGKKGNGTLAEAIEQGISVFATEKDVKLRGITKLIRPEIRIVDYGKMIDLVMSYEKIINI